MLAAGSLLVYVVSLVMLYILAERDNIEVREMGEMGDGKENKRDRGRCTKIDRQIDR